MHLSVLPAKATFLKPVLPHHTCKPALQQGYQLPWQHPKQGYLMASASASGVPDASARQGTPCGSSSSPASTAAPSSGPSTRSGACCREGKYNLMSLLHPDHRTQQSLWLYCMHDALDESPYSQHVYLLHACMIWSMRTCRMPRQTGHARWLAAAGGLAAAACPPGMRSGAAAPEAGAPAAVAALGTGVCTSRECSAAGTVGPSAPASAASLATAASSPCSGGPSAGCAAGCTPGCLVLAPLKAASPPAGSKHRTPSVCSWLPGGESPGQALCAELASCRARAEALEVRWPSAFATCCSLAALSPRHAAPFACPFSCTGATAALGGPAADCCGVRALSTAAASAWAEGTGSM